MSELKINKCFCGRKARAYVLGRIGEYMVDCDRTECWSGPVKKTEKQAIDAWNKRTEKGEKK